MSSTMSEEDPLIVRPSNEKKAKQTLRSSSLRWFALGLACSINFGNYFSYDNPQALQSYLMNTLNISGTQFNLLYSVYSFPNIVLPLFGGLLIDKIGIRVAVMLFASLLIIGQIITTVGAAELSYPMMIVGRIFFGLGAESLTVSQSTITAKWFMGKELAFAMGVTLCVSRLGSSLNSFMSPKIYLWSGEQLYAPFLTGVVLCCLSWVGGFCLTFIDKRAEADENSTGEQRHEGDSIRLSDLKKFDALFYLLLFNCFFLYGAFFGLNNNLNDLMVSRFGFTPNSAGNFIPIIYLCSAAITPFFGMLTDHFGKRVLLMVISSVIFLLDHLFIAFLRDAEPGTKNYMMAVALLGVGLFYSTYAAIFWPCISLIVQEKVTGTAYGLITSLQNLMLALIPLIIGAVHDNTKEYKSGYFWTEILLAGVVAVGLGVTVAMYFLDLKKGGKLDKPGSKRVD